MPGLRHTLPFIKTHNYRLIIGILLLVALFTSITPLAKVEAQAANLPNGFTEALVVGGLTSPTLMQFAPDGRLFVTEQDGRLRVIQNDVLLPQPFLTVPVNTVSERGLTGVTFDPNFAANGYVYIYYTAPNPYPHNRISRFTANGNVAVPGSEVILFEFPQLNGLIHNSGSMDFGPDGMLYVAVGDDDQNPNTNPHLAETLNTVFGKVLRLNADGTIPADNPFYNVTNGDARGIWAYGLRSPFHIAFQPGTGRLYNGDVGENTWEELNEIVRGGNYGWPDSEGNTNNPAFRTPLHAYIHGAPGQNGPDAGCAITAGAFYNPGFVQFPAQYVGKYFFADYCREWVKTYDPNNGNIELFATALRNAVVGFQVSADGSLYYLSRGGGPGNGAVMKITFGNNVPPAITLNPENTLVGIGQPVTLTCEASSNTPFTYQWQRNGVNIPGANTNTLTIPAADLADNGATYRCVATNAYGATPSLGAVLTVLDNDPPLGTITFPPDGSFYNAGDVIHYTGTGVDPEDGNLAGASFTWWIDFHHGDHTHPYMLPTAGFDEADLAITTDDHGDHNVWYRIYLLVTDSVGFEHQSYVEIFPRKINTTLNSEPQGLQIYVDGGPRVAPYTFTNIVGITHTLDPLSPQVLPADNTEWAFLNWSDNEPKARPLTLPEQDVDLTVFFEPTTPPIIVQDPADVTAIVGEDATFSCLADSPSAVTYQWQRDGVDIANATATSFTLNNVRLADRGSTFSCIATNAYGSAQSNSGLLIVRPAPVAGQPGNGGNNGAVIDIFDPALSKIGVPSTGGFGIVGESITWTITAQNNGGQPGKNVIVTDTIHSDMSVDGAQTGKGTYSISGQTVTFNIGTLNPGESVEMKIFTTVLNSPIDGYLINPAELTGLDPDDILMRRRAQAEVPIVGALPRTGEAQRSGPPLAVLLAAAGGLGLAIGVGYSLLRERRLQPR